MADLEGMPGRGACIREAESPGHAVVDEDDPFGRRIRPAARLHHHDRAKVGVAARDGVALDAKFSELLLQDPLQPPLPAAGRVFGGAGDTSSYLHAAAGRGVPGFTVRLSKAPPNPM